MSSELEDDIKKLAVRLDFVAIDGPYFKDAWARIQRLARLGARVEDMPQGICLARHGALGATRWCVSNVEDENDSIDGEDALAALTNAAEWMKPFREPAQ